MVITKQPVMIEKNHCKSKYGLFSSEAERKLVLQPYEGALAQVNILMSNLNNEYASIFGKAPIQNIISRLKSTESIESKLLKMGFEPSASHLDKIYDIAGIRGICYYRDDVYKVASYLTDRDDIRLLKKSDYIETPKPNGYRSLHLVLEIKVYSMYGYNYVPVEIQLRTAAMDLWASIEHQMIYKSQTNATLETREKMRICAEAVNRIDNFIAEVNTEQSGIRWEHILSIGEKIHV